MDAAGCLGVLVGDLDSQFDEFSLALDKSLAHSKALVLGEDFELLSKESAITDGDTSATPNREVLITALERSRVQLVEDIQVQEHIFDQMRDIVADDEDLVSTILEHFQGRERQQDREEQDFSQQLRRYEQDKIGEKCRALDREIVAMKTALGRIKASVATSLTNLEGEHEKLLSESFKNDLDDAIAQLNAGYKDFVAV